MRAVPLFVSLMSAEAATELQLEPGVLAVASVKSTHVVVEVPADLVNRTQLPKAGKHLGLGGPRWSSASCFRLAAALNRKRQLPSPSPAGSSAGGTITVLAAASLTEAFNQIGKDFEAKNPGSKVTFSFGSSATLATQIVQGAPADVFAAASPATMKAVDGGRRCEYVRGLCVQHPRDRSTQGKSAQDHWLAGLRRCEQEDRPVRATGALWCSGREGLRRCEDRPQAGHLGSKTSRRPCRKSHLTKSMLRWSTRPM